LDLQLVHSHSDCPAGWTLTEVGKACTICDELRLPLNVDEREQMPGPYPYYGPTGILDHLNEFRLDGRYALIGEDGDHFLKYWDWPMTQLVDGKFNVNNHAHVVQGRSACRTEWFHLYFHHMCLRPVLTLQGVGRYKLTRQALERLPISVPPPGEQERIVQIVQKWTDSIALNEKLIAAKLRLKQGLKQQLLTGKRRFNGFRDERRHATFGSFLTESRVPGTNGAEARKLTIRLYGKGVVAKSDTRPGSEATQFYRRKSGQLIYSKLDFLNGAFGIVPHELDGFETSLDLPAFDVANSIDPRWLLYFLTYPGFYRNQLGLAHGGRKARRVNPSELLKLSVSIPEKAEQRRIADALESFDREIDLLRKQLGALKTQKKGLMQKLLTGQIRVGNH